MRKSRERVRRRLVDRRSLLRIATATLLSLTLPVPHVSDTFAESPKIAARRSPAVEIRIEEPGRLLIAPGRVIRTVVVDGLHTAGARAQLDWQIAISTDVVARGSSAMAVGPDQQARAPITLPLPEIPGPAGAILSVVVEAGGRRTKSYEVPFTLYPPDPGLAIVSILAESSIALYDPAGQAGTVLRTLSSNLRPIGDLTALRSDTSDLIVVGSGGFGRGDEALGPVLAERARAGTPVLLLGQESLPGTLTDRLRLWPSFRRGPETEILVASGHPVMHGLAGDRGAGYFASDHSGRRPFFPPTRGNFRILAGMRVRRGGAWQEGVGIVEFPIGPGTVLATQSSLCDDYPHDARARILLTNAVAYLLGEPPPLGGSFVYGHGEDALPACIAGLDPDAPAAPADLAGVELLLVPADWRATRGRGELNPAPLARVAAFLRDGGTVLLLNPQSLVADYLSSLIGESVGFTPRGRTNPGEEVAPIGAATKLLQGVAPEDLRLLDRPGEREFRLLAARATDRFEPLLVVPGLSYYRVGRGDLVALTVPPADECGSPRINSLLARLLTNLGVPLDTGHHPTAQARSRIGR